MIKESTIITALCFLVFSTASRSADLQKFKEKPICGFSGRAVVTASLSVLAGWKQMEGRQFVLSFSDEKFRMDFIEQRRAVVLQINLGAEVAWLIDDRGRAIPLRGKPLRLRFDPFNPCAHLGMFVRCTALPDALVNYRPSKRWKVENAGLAGPLGQNNSEIAVDSQTGLLLQLLDRRGRILWNVVDVYYSRELASRFLPANLPSAVAHPLTITKCLSNEEV